MVKRFEDIKPERLDHFKGGEQFVIRIASVEAGEFSEYADVVAKLILQPGSSIGYHEHVDNGEVLTILSGNGRYVEDGEEYFLQTGDVTICNKGHKHSFENLSETEDLVLFATVIKE